MTITLEGISIIVALIIQLIIVFVKAGKVEERLATVTDAVHEIKMEFKNLHNVIFTRDDANRELAIAEKEHKAIWNKIEKLEERILPDA